MLPRRPLVAPPPPLPPPPRPRRATPGPGRSCRAASAAGRPRSPPPPPPPPFAPPQGDDGVHVRKKQRLGGADREIPSFIVHGDDECSYRAADASDFREKEPVPTPSPRQEITGTAAAAAWPASTGTSVHSDGRGCLTATSSLMTSRWTTCQTSRCTTTRWTTSRWTIGKISLTQFFFLIRTDSI
ncbi:hypothetical protein PVAP13_5KG005324 [Panicum virgatum]|uniref:Uncharacterized protein n=1 Tax=Panicum virgatum TaxID=38727 RepID=A0A8T0S8Z7_PANVG|nr:hypothetical protein PVAP13_5KG005324 [Panicum virgatum]